MPVTLKGGREEESLNFFVFFRKMLDKQKKLWYDVGVKCAGVVQW